VGVPGTGVPGVPGVPKESKRVRAQQLTESGGKESKRVRAQQLTESGGIIDNSPFSIFVKKGGI